MAANISFTAFRSDHFIWAFHPCYLLKAIFLLTAPKALGIALLVSRIFVIKHFHSFVLLLFAARYYEEDIIYFTRSINFEQVNQSKGYLASSDVSVKFLNSCGSHNKQTKARNKISDLNDISVFPVS